VTIAPKVDSDPGLAGILERAAARARAKGLSYAGEVTPAEAWRLHDAGAAQIVDVRTRPEHEFVGRIPGTPLVEWRRYGDTPFARPGLAGMRRNAAAVLAGAGRGE